MSSNLLIIHEIVSQDSQHNLKEAKALAKIYMRERERDLLVIGLVIRMLERAKWRQQPWRFSY